MCCVLFVFCVIVDCLSYVWCACLCLCVLTVFVCFGCGLTRVFLCVRIAFLFDVVVRFACELSCEVVRLACLCVMCVCSFVYCVLVCLVCDL